MRTCICINREYGVNGGVIAEAVEKSTGLPVFDSELRDMAVSGAGIDREALDLNESKKLNTWLEEHFYGEKHEGKANYAGEFPKEILIKSMEHSIVEVCGKQDCIILGKCADQILWKYTDYNVISVFVSAPLGRRVRTVMAREDMNELMAKLRIRKIDSLRRDLFRYYVSDDDEQEKGSWGHADAYDLCFNAAHMDPASIADVIARVYKAKSSADL
jgi:cytidylate kinase